ncbi:MAG TPA: MerR family transcriptional regulator [Rickettsiales bacterium]|nr:MerR family transcriptional regulator [Rickettsiales bacterium]
MKIGELAKQSGLTVHTIRYYERIGLLPYAVRDKSRQRDYDVSILGWIQFLNRLKMTGMPIREILEYGNLRERGAETAAQRQEMLKRHKKRIEHQMAELEASLSALDVKIALYDDIIRKGK